MKNISRWLKVPLVTWTSCCHVTIRNEDRDERNRKATYDVMDGTADCEDWYVGFTHSVGGREPNIIHSLLRWLLLPRSPKPTLEEVRSWGQSFDKLMCCPAGRNSFRQFLRTEFSEENMLFWLACDEFRKDTNKSVVEEKARVIYEDYISILSPKEVPQLPQLLLCLLKRSNSFKEDR